MQCTACGHKNRDEARFCEECASALALARSHCGVELRATAKFCDACGTGLGRTAAAARPEADFREAIALAQQMGAKALELRATMSLARLLAAQGHRDKARTLLAEIYGLFTEGFDTRDLKEANALLEELG